MRMPTLFPQPTKELPPLDSMSFFYSPDYTRGIISAFLMFAVMGFTFAGVCWLLFLNNLLPNQTPFLNDLSGSEGESDGPKETDSSGAKGEKSGHGDFHGSGRHGAPEGDQGKFKTSSRRRSP